MLLYPDKCILCGELLQRHETDLCHRCREKAPVFTKSKKRFSFVAGWTSLWYYKDTARDCVLRFKFCKKQNYAPALGRLLALKLQTADFTDFDVLTYVPVSFLRRWKRGYDQTALLAQAVADQLGVPLVPCLVKQRHTRPQSTLARPEQRRANIAGAYRVKRKPVLQDKRVLLLDDIITTGATINECARVLLMAGAKEVRAAAIAAAPDDKNKQ